MADVLAWMLMWISTHGGANSLNKILGLTRLATTFKASLPVDVYKRWDELRKNLETDQETSNRTMAQVAQQVEQVCTQFHASQWTHLLNLLKADKAYEPNFLSLVTSKSKASLAESTSAASVSFLSYLIN